jgi:hypothetical protein
MGFDKLENEEGGTRFDAPAARQAFSATVVRCLRRVAPAHAPAAMAPVTSSMAAM